MGKIAGLLFALSLAAVARGQGAPATGSLQGKLERLATVSEDLQQHLPSFTCKESLVSREIRSGKVKREVRAAGEVRVLRDVTGKLSERFQATEQNGKTIGPDKLKVPIFVSGGFKNALDPFQAEAQPCFHFSVSGNRVDFESPTEAPAPGCDRHSGVRGFALLNDGGDIVHLERKVPEDVAEARNAVPDGAIDLSRIELGDKSFLLSTHVIAEIPKGTSTYRWEATYTACRLFSVAVKIGPATPVDPDDHGSGALSGPANP